ncbi:unnamed protein product, partial [Durusdinium trenchii]
MEQASQEALTQKAWQFWADPANKGLQANGEDEVLEAHEAACLAAIFLVEGRHPEVEKLTPELQAAGLLCCVIGQQHPYFEQLSRHNISALLHKPLVNSNGPVGPVTGKGDNFDVVHAGAGAADKPMLPVPATQPDIVKPDPVPETAAFCGSDESSPEDEEEDGSQQAQEAPQEEPEEEEPDSSAEVEETSEEDEGSPEGEAEKGSNEEEKQIEPSHESDSPGEPSETERQETAGRPRKLPRTLNSSQFVEVKPAKHKTSLGQARRSPLPRLRPKKTECRSENTPSQSSRRSENVSEDRGASEEMAGQSRRRSSSKSRTSRKRLQRSRRGIRSCDRRRRSRSRRARTRRSRSLHSQKLNRRLPYSEAERPQSHWKQDFSYIHNDQRRREHIDRMQTERDIREQRERDQKERELREQKHKEQKDKELRELRDQREKEQKERELREQREKEQKARELREQREKEQQDRELRDQKEKEQKERELQEQREKEQKDRELREQREKERLREQIEKDQKERELKQQKEHESASSAPRHVGSVVRNQASQLQSQVQIQLQKVEIHPIRALARITLNRAEAAKEILRLHPSHIRGVKTKKLEIPGFDPTSLLVHWEGDRADLDELALRTHFSHLIEGADKARGADISTAAQNASNQAPLPAAGLQGRPDDPSPKSKAPGPAGLHGRPHDPPVKSKESQADILVEQINQAVREREMFGQKQDQQRAFMEQQGQLQQQQQLHHQQQLQQQQQVFQELQASFHKVQEEMEVRQRFLDHASRQPGFQNLSQGERNMLAQFQSDLQQLQQQRAMLEQQLQAFYSAQHAQASHTSMMSQAQAVHQAEAQFHAHMQQMQLQPQPYMQQLHQVQTAQVQDHLQTQAMHNMQQSQMQQAQLQQQAQAQAHMQAHMQQQDAHMNQQQQLAKELQEQLRREERQMSQMKTEACAKQQASTPPPPPPKSVPHALPPKVLHGSPSSPEALQSVSNPKVPSQASALKSEASSEFHETSNVPAGVLKLQRISDAGNKQTILASPISPIVVGKGAKHGKAAGKTGSVAATDARPKIALTAPPPKAQIAGPPAPPPSQDLAPCMEGTTPKASSKVHAAVATSAPKT